MIYYNSKRSSLMIVFSFVQVIGFSMGSNDTGNGYYFEACSQQYFRITENVNWKRGQEICNEQNMTLVSLDSQQKQNCIAEALIPANETGKNFAYWTDGSDKGHAERFYWHTNGEPLVFTSWAPGSPNRFMSTHGLWDCICVVFRYHGGNSTKWENFPCSATMYAICET